MDPPTSAKFKMDSNKEKESSYLPPMDQNMTEIGSMEKNMEKEQSSTRMAQDMKENSNKDKNLEKGL